MHLDNANLGNQKGARLDFGYPETGKVACPLYPPPAQQVVGPREDRHFGVAHHPPSRVSETRGSEFRGGWGHRHPKPVVAEPVVGREAEAVDATGVPRVGAERAATHHPGRRALWRLAALAPYLRRQPLPTSGPPA